MSFIFKPTPVATTTTTTTKTTTRTHSGRNKALCTGLNNYPGTQNDLNGCLNDAVAWSSLLQNVYGYGVVSLKDSKLIKKSFTEIAGNYIADSKAGDKIVLTYSGHGTNVPDIDGDEADGRDEAICLYDGLLLDDDIRKMMKNLHPEAMLTFISDSCHSGTVTRAFINVMSEDDAPKPKYLPPEDDNEVLGISAGKVKNKIFYPEEGMNEILISGCLPTEYSYDARIGGTYHGAMTYYAIEVLKQNPTITYASFYQELRRRLPSSRYPQTPQLEGSEANKNKLMF